MTQPAMSIDYLQLFLCSTAVAATLTVLLLVKSILSFTRTGPSIRDEILQRYGSYTVYALARLGVFAFLLMLWMGLIGTIPGLAVTLLLHVQPGCTVLGMAALASVAAITALQFCKHLLLIPTSIMMNSHYSMQRFIGLHRRLSVSRLRWAELTILVALLASAVLVYAALDDAVTSKLGFIVFMAVLALPYLLSATPGTSGLFTPKARAGKRMNLLMIGSDTLRADHIGARHKQQPLTPFIDTLTAKGTLFSNCLVSIARTAPALVSIFTGTLPNTNGIKLNYIADDKTRITQPGLASILAKHGYATAAVTDWAGSDLAKFPLGFQHYDGPPDQWNLKFLIRQGPKDLRLLLSLFTHNPLGRRILPEIYYLAGKPMTKLLGNGVRARLNHHARSGEPFFLNAFLSTTHPPFGSEYPYYQYFADPKYRGESIFGMSRLTDPIEIIRSQKQPREAFDLDQVLDLYKGCVRNFDDEVRRIMAHLRKTGLDRNTLVVIYSDHGMEFFENDTWGQGNSIRGKASNRIPLLIIDPRNPEPRTSKQLVRAIDIMPTLLDLLGLEAPETVEGTSLKPLMDGGTLPDLVGFCETGLWLATPPGQHPEHIRYPELLELLEIPDMRTGTLALHKEYRAVVEAARDRMTEMGAWRLLQTPLNDQLLSELYDLDSDPGCTKDVSEANIAVAHSLARLLPPLDCRAGTPGAASRRGQIQ